MCFSKKMKVPKPNTDQKAPEPVLLEAPKGIEFGGDAETVDKTDDNESSAKGLSSLKVGKDTGDGSKTSTTKDTGLDPSVKKKASTPSIKRALKR